jgi:hypothetical protein
MPGGEGNALAKVAQAMQRHEVHVLDARRPLPHPPGGIDAEAAGLGTRTRRPSPRSSPVLVTTPSTT